MRRLAAVCCLFAMGCASFRDAFNEDMLYWKMRSEAGDVWSDCRHSYPEDQPYSDDFELGFKDGYIAVAFGANGCPPTLPRQDYWKPKFKSDEGRARIAAWYNGYAAGAYAALSIGVQDRNRLPTAAEMYGRSHMRSSMAGATLMPAYPELTPLPPEPETPPAPMAPPVTEPLPLEPLPQGAWRSTPANNATVESAVFESGSEPQPADAATIQQMSGTEGLAGEFGLSRPE